MKLVIGHASLRTDFDFEILRKNGPFTSVEGRYGSINKVGVYLSGGLDSMALTCLILTELRNIGKLGTIPVTCFTVAKSDGPTLYATRLIPQIENHFSITLRHVNDIPNDPIPDLTGNLGGYPIKFIKEYDPNMVVYMGNNRMAADDIRPFSQRLIIDYGHRKITPVYSSPFLFLHKPQILDIIYQLGCEDLIPYTHSCTVLPVGACGQCYSCAERKWAFDALGKTDPGTLPILS